MTSAASAPPLGLLLDVDGPIACPHTRSVSQPTIVPDLLALLRVGVPVVFNTGRSDAFLRDQVVAPLLAAGLPPAARLHAICEKGSVWFTVTAAGAGPVQVDDDLAVPPACGQAIADLVRQTYSTTMSVDATKRSMATVESRTDIPLAEFTAAQRAFDDDLFDLLAASGLGVVMLDRRAPDARGELPWRIDPTIISTDVESSAVGKDLGARRAELLLAADGPLPRAWLTMGDSATDYAMADQLHALGRPVTHVDVRPAGTLVPRPYRVRTHPTLIDDAFGAGVLRELAAAHAGPPRG